MFFVLRPGIRSLLDLEQNGVLQHAKAVAAGNDDRYIPRSENAGGRQLTGFTVDADLAQPFPHHDDFRGAANLTLHGKMRVSFDFSTFRIHDETHLEVVLRRRDKGRLVRPQFRWQDIGQRPAIV